MSLDEPCWAAEAVGESGWWLKRVSLLVGLGVEVKRGGLQLSSMAGCVVELFSGPE